MHYNDDQMLLLSGIQHYMFCPRQWALAYIDQQWADNRLTVEGTLLHKNVDNPTYRQKNGETITLHAVHVASHTLGLYGICDAIELQPSATAENAIGHPRYAGHWRPYPIEYKRGHRKPDERDEVQLCAQVICLEEMHGISIHEAAIFYHETRHREVVSIDDHLRRLTTELSLAMHRDFDSGAMPAAVNTPHCRSCSLVDICVPQIHELPSVRSYLKRNLNEETA